MTSSKPGPTLTRFEWGAMSRANDPDCRVGLFCSGTEESGRHQERQLGIAGWFSGSPDEMRIYDSGDGGVLGEHLSGHRGIAYTLKCQDCGRSMTLMIPDLRDRITSNYSSTLPGSDPKTLESQTKRSGPHVVRHRWHSQPFGPICNAAVRTRSPSWMRWTTAVPHAGQGLGRLQRAGGSRSSLICATQCSRTSDIWPRRFVSSKLHVRSVSAENLSAVELPRLQHSDATSISLCHPGTGPPPHPRTIRGRINPSCSVRTPEKIGHILGSCRK